MEKIFSITVAKNEADIIETFVRYHMKIFDGMLILDNFSTDQTLEILNNLKQEGLPLYIVQDQEREPNQAQKTTMLMNKAIKEYNADTIIVLDADEFLFSPNKRGNPRRFLKNLRNDTVYFWPMLNYACSIEETQFDLFQAQKYRPFGWNKIAVKKHLIKTYGFYNVSHDISIPIENYYPRLTEIRIAQAKSDKKGEVVYQMLPDGRKLNCKKYLSSIKEKLQYNAIVHSDLALAHFPYRSLCQMRSKTFIKAVNKTAMTNIYREEIDMYRKPFLDLFSMDLNTIKDKYFNLNQEKAVDCAIDLSYQTNLILHYTPKQVNFILNMFHHSIQLAEDYYELKKSCSSNFRL